MPQDTFQRVNISLYAKDLADLHQIGKDVGSLNRSATIRFLIKYFKRTEIERSAAKAYAVEMDDEPCAISLT